MYSIWIRMTNVGEGEAPSSLSHWQYYSSEESCSLLGKLLEEEKSMQFNFQASFA